MMDVNVKVHVDFPAMDRLVDFLCMQKTETVTAPAIEEKPVEVAEEKIIPIKPKKAKKEEPVVEDKPEEPVGMPADEVVAEPQTAVEAPAEEERKYTAEELASAAVKLRDIDKNNAKLIKDKFPEIGIKSIGDLRTNEAARKPFAELLISLGAEL